MYERFTDRARKVMQFANQEAKRFNHDCIGTEHILLGLVKEESGVAANVLKNLDVDLRKIRLEVEKIVQSGPEMVTMDKLPQTPRAKKVIEYSMEEARNLNHNHVGTEHILLGLLREKEGIASHVLTNLGLKLEEVRDSVAFFCGVKDSSFAQPEAPVETGFYKSFSGDLDLLRFYAAAALSGLLAGRRSGDLPMPYADAISESFTVARLMIQEESRIVANSASSHEWNTLVQSVHETYRGASCGKVTD